MAYRDEEELLPLAEALRRGLDLSQAQVRIEYENGLTLWVNRAARQSWTVGLGEERQYELPPSGFLALAPGQRLTVFSALLEGHRVDACYCPEYTFVDVRSPHLRRVEEVAVDGSAVLEKSAVPGRQDVLLIGARQLAVGEEEFRLSERGDLRLRFLSSGEVEILLLDTENGKPAQVSWPAFAPEWEGSQFDVREWTEGDWRASRCPVQPSRTGPQLSRVQCGVLYRVRPGP